MTWILAEEAAKATEASIPWIFAAPAFAALATAIAWLAYALVKAQDARVALAERVGETRSADAAKTATVVAESSAQLARMAERLDRVLGMLEKSNESFAAYAARHP